MLGRTIQSQPVLSTDETNALFEVVTDYSYSKTEKRKMKINLNLFCNLLAYSYLCTRFAIFIANRGFVSA
jgi:hypothetical protein